MKQFYRIFEYVWPQWHRIAIIFISVLLISVFFMFSYATITPLLTVMMGTEGVHGWADRKICQDRYDLKFYVPDSMDLIDTDKKAAYQLRITYIDDDSTAYKAGLRKDFWIVGVNDKMPGLSKNIPITDLLEELATVDDAENLKVMYRHIDPNDESKNVASLATFNADKKPFYADIAQRALSLVPRTQSKQSRLNAIVFILTSLIFVTIFRCFFRFLQDYTVNKVVQSSLANLRFDMFSHSLYMQAGFFTKEGSFDTVSRMIRDTDTTGQGIKILMGKAIREPVKAIFLLGYAFYTAPELTLIFLTCVPATLFVVGRLGKKIKKATKKSLLSWSQMLGKLEEAISSIRIVKIYNREESEKQNFAKINNSLLKQLLKIAKVNAATSPIMESVAMIAASTGLIFGAYWVSKGDMEPAEFFTLLVVLGTIAEAIRRTSDVWNKVQQSNAAAERVYSIIDQPTEPTVQNPVELEPVKDKIEFKNIFFTYPGNQEPTLKNISLEIKAGSKIAIVGPNGSGKSTLASLLPRFYDPDSGAITIDNTDIKQATYRSLRSQMGLVTQNTMTFNDTIANNIAYGNQNATEQQIIEAAKRSYAHEFIINTPKGYDTVIGQSGAGLSGGQLQRIAIARAIIKNPKILIFDEATSQIDADSEAKIHTAIEDFMQGRTSIIIAHRFSTILKADIIVVMDNGEIVDIGSHEQLVKSSKLYNSLYETQLIQS